MSMHYVTKVDDVHVIEIDGNNRQVQEKKERDGVCKYVFDDTLSVNVSDYTVYLSSYRGTHLATIVLAIEIAKLINSVKESK